MKIKLQILSILILLVGNIFSQPILQSPADGSEGVPTSPRITWSVVPKANAYWLRVGTNNPGDQNIIDEDVGYINSKTISGLEYNTTYYVQFWSSSNEGATWSPGSAVYSFTTEPESQSVYTHSGQPQSPQVYYPPSQKSSDVKTSGIKTGVIFPVGEWADKQGIGFTVADLTKWYITKYVRALGRVELVFIGGKHIKEEIYPGPPEPIYLEYSTDPVGVLTAGTGFEFGFPGSKLYGILDFPSMNIIVGGNSSIRVGFGLGFGFEFSWGKSVFGLEARANLYNALLTEYNEKSIAGVQVGFMAGF